MLLGCEILNLGEVKAADWISIAAIVVTGTGIIIALYYSIKQSKIANKQMRVSVFADYTKRYQEITLNFPLNINEKDFDIFKLENEHPKRYDETMRYMRIYFDLCSEEFFLNEEGYLDEKVWEDWRKGIEYTFQLTAFRDSWGIVNQNSLFYNEFANWINSEVLNNSKPNLH